MKPTVESRGFTLLEALVAGGIFFIAVVAVSLLAVQGSANASRGMRYAQASRVATQELEKLAMMEYSGIQTLTGGVFPYNPGLYRITDEPDGGGRVYSVNVNIVDSSGPMVPSPDGGPPGPGLGVPSYYVSVQVTSLIPNTDAGVTVSQATYVSPP